MEEERMKGNDLAKIGQHGILVDNIHISPYYISSIPDTLKIDHVEEHDYYEILERTAG